MKKSLLLTFIFIAHLASGQSDTVSVVIDLPSITQSLLSSPNELNTGVGNFVNSQQTVLLPHKRGQIQAFKIIEYYVVPVELRKNIKTYYGQMVSDPSVTCRITLANGDISASFSQFSETFILEKNKQSTNSSAYVIYEPVLTPAECGIVQLPEKVTSEVVGNTTMFTSHGTQLRTYRLALLATNSLYVAGGGTDALVNAYVATIVNNINELFEKEISVRFVLVSPNNPVSTNVFYNYTGAENLTPIRAENDLRFGNANFDVGHCIRASGGGVAFLGVVCNSTYKGGGLSGVSPSSILIFAHELGHQFNANHTFNGNGSGNCGAGNRANNDAYEPGSGNTIMSYANLCNPGSYNLTGGKVPYFHTRSQTTMINHTLTRPAGCGVVSNTNNAAPVVTTLSSLTIPKNTPFTLSGSATDIDGDPLTFTWEQYDLAAVSDSGRLGNTANTSGISAVNSTTAPLFRTRQSTTGTRNFPDVSYVLGDSNNPADNIGEDLPNVGRVMNFRLTARDNKAGGGGIAYQAVAVTVDETAGPLEVSSFNSALIIAAGSTQMITWNVNNTNLITENVKISLSVDGGNSFPYILSATTANDGSEQVTIPSNVVSTTNGRIKVSSLHHPSAEFFDVNNLDIMVTSDCSAAVSLICSSVAVNLPQGDPGLDLNTSYIINSNFFRGSKVFDNSGVSSMANFYHTSGDLVGCVERPSSNSKVIPIQVRKSGNYTFSINNGDFIGLTVYDSEIPSCNSLIGSNRYFENGTTWTYSTRTLSLLECKTYYIVVNSNSIFTLNINGVGDVLEVLPLPDGIGYTFAAINKATNQISEISATANFTSIGAGNYDVVGLSYENSFNPTSLISQTVSQAYGTGSCILFSGNSKGMAVISTPCPPSLTFVSPIDDISTGAVKQETSGAITATNSLIGGNVIYDAAQSILLNPGFTVNSGVVFSAYIDGCGGQ